jgi:hypothetical protein
MRHVAFLAAACFLSACTLGGGPVGTPTLTSGEVVQTAEAEALQTREAAPPSPTRVLSTPTPSEPAATPTTAFTSTPSSVLATADQTANVRLGPGTNYEWIDFLFQGQSAEIVGRYESDVDGTWWRIHRLGQGLDGWVWGGVITTSGDLSGVPYLLPPPTSTPAPQPTATSTETPTATP